MKLTLCALAFIASLAVVSGCSRSASTSGIVVQDSEMSTGVAVAAVFISPQNTTEVTGPGQNESYLALIDRSGKVRAVHAEPMQTGRPVWEHEDEIFAADRRSDFLVTNTHTARTDHQKPSAQIASYSTGAAGNYGAVYNDGLNKTGYTVIVSSTSGSQYRDLKVTGYYLTASRCEDATYGLALESSEAQTPSTSPGATAVLKFAQLSPTKTREAGLVSQSRVSESTSKTDSAMTIPCNKRSIVTFNDDNDQSGMKPLVFSVWNSQTGTSRQITLSDEKKKPLLFEQGQFAVDIGANNRSFDGTNIDWSYSDGSVWRTNATTGVSMKLFDIGQNWLGKTHTTVDFTATSFVTLTVGDDDTGKLRVYNRADGSKTLDVTATDLKKLMTDNIRVEGMAARPSL